MAKGKIPAGLKRWQAEQKRKKGKHRKPGARRKARRTSHTKRVSRKNPALSSYIAKQLGYLGTSTGRVSAPAVRKVLRHIKTLI